MNKQVITLSDRAAERVKEIIASAKETNCWCKSWCGLWWMRRHVLCYGIRKKN